MKIKIKKLVKEAVIPKYSKHGDAGMDLVAVSKEYDKYGNLVYGTGLAIEIPEGYEGQVRPRSSIGKVCLALVNSLGTIDSGYRGEIGCFFKPTDAFTTRDASIPKEYEIGDRIAQLIIKPVPFIEFIEIDELSKTERGEGGFGSTGNT